MEVKLDVIQDSWNSYPHDEIEFTITDELVHFRITTEAEDRRLSIKRSEFVKLLKFVEGDAPNREF